jgi:hypothetical protein
MALRHSGLALLAASIVAGELWDKCRSQPERLAPGVKFLHEFARGRFIFRESGAERHGWQEPFTVPLSSEVRHSDSVGLVQIKKPGVGAASQIPWRYVEQAACRSFRDEQGLF